MEWSTEEHNVGDDVLKVALKQADIRWGSGGAKSGSSRLNGERERKCGLIILICDLCDFFL